MEGTWYHIHQTSPWCWSGVPGSKKYQLAEELWADWNERLERELFQEYSSLSTHTYHAGLCVLEFHGVIYRLVVRARMAITPVIFKYLKAQSTKKELRSLQDHCAEMTMFKICFPVWKMV